ncbi:MAG: RebB like protein [Lysobacteraceae bacterium]|nr:MAG: RebB like protein [Xanthomonadaceae bacterium]
MAGVNEQITDAVTQTNVKVVAEAPAQAIAALYQVASHSVGISLQNAVHSQQVLNQISTAVVSKAATLIMAIGESGGGGGGGGGG